MTNPTSNFGWQMPTGTDLVKDLPADFETFGQAVDTSMADLKGGTTGQILSKASNTDMDFTWAASPSTPSATPNLEGKVYGKTSSNNAALGQEALNALTSGQSNTALGYQSAISCTSGSNNISIGQASNYYNTTGGYNISIGIFANPKNGTANIGIGESTMYWNNNGSNNVAIGPSAMSGTAGSPGGWTENTAVGFNAMAQLYSSANQNTSLGSNAGRVLQQGNNNTMLGYYAGASGSSASNEFTLGNSSVATLRCQVTSITSLSDARDKKNVEPLNVGLDFIKELKPVTFDWDMRPDADDENAPRKVDVPDMGFIAQDLVAAEDAIGLADHLQLTYRNNPEKLEASQGRLVPILVKAIQDLAAQNEALAARVTALEAK